MSYLDGMWKRVDLQHICEFILNGGKKEVYEDSSYEERLKNATVSMRARIENKYLDGEE